MVEQASQPALPTVKTCARLAVFDVIRNDKLQSLTRRVGPSRLSVTYHSGPDHIKAESSGAFAGDNPNG
jgi:hypothetical protein